MRWTRKRRAAPGQGTGNRIGISRNIAIRPDLHVRPQIDGVRDSSSAGHNLLRDRRERCPRRFGVDTATLPGLGEEAIAFLRNWRFTPGLKNGATVAVPCKFDFAWGL